MVNTNDIRGPIPAKPTKFMHQLRAFIQARNLAYATEGTYCLWVKRYIFYHNKQHPKNDIRTVQELLGHSNVETTEIYTHVLHKGVWAFAALLIDKPIKPEQYSGFIVSFNRLF